MPLSRLLPASFEQPNPVNFVINGNQIIDQRNSGSALTASASHQYATDRFICRLGTSSSSTIQQVSDAPDGFEKSMKLTIGTGASPSSSTGTGYFAHRIEGNNIAHLGWGSSGAKTVTLSFWVKSSVTGSFGVTLSNFDASRSYPSSYTISSANTWQYITVTVSGDTSGTWKTDANSGIEMWFDWGNGSNFKGTANTWAGSDYRGGATGTVNICATSSATWQITGVVLNEGSKAETFKETYAETLDKCLRYYQKHLGWITQFSRGLDSNYDAHVVNGGVNIVGFMRATPTETIANVYRWDAGDSNWTSDSTAFSAAISSSSQTFVEGYYGRQNCNAVKADWELIAEL